MAAVEFCCDVPQTSSCALQLLLAGLLAGLLALQ